jgi:hypothetical protein
MNLLPKPGAKTVLSQVACVTENLRVGVLEKYQPLFGGDPRHLLTSCETAATRADEIGLIEELASKRITML